MKQISLLFLFLCFSIMLQAQVSKTVSITAGGLSDALNATEKSTITNLTVTGTIDARDFKTMRDDIPVLVYLNLSGVSILAHTGSDGTVSYNKDFPANAIPERSFIYKQSLKTAILPLTVKIIGSQAFVGCSNLSSINITEGVTSIEMAAFQNCNKLASIKVPSTVTSIARLAFAIEGLVVVHVDNLNFTSSDGILFNKDETALFQCTLSKTGSYTIPSTVVSIEDDAFRSCVGLTSIIIPSSVNTIKESAFSLCNGLSSIDIPSSVTSIAIYAFSDSPALINVAASNPNYSSSDGVLYNKTKTNLILCPISKSGSYVIPTTVSSIELYAFNNCSNLTSVTIPSSVTSIDVNAFNYCTGLTLLKIPSSVSYCGSGAFGGNYNLTSLAVTWPVPLDMSSSPGVLTGIDYSICTLYVPHGKKSLYAAADQWEDFTSIAEMPDIQNKLSVTSNVSNSTSICFNAYDTIKVAGTGTVTFESGSTVDLIAGKAIILLPGFHAASGSSTHAYITEDGTFCLSSSSGSYSAFLSEKSTEIQSDSEKQVVAPEEKSVKVYPNPNNGEFTLELTNIESVAIVSIYNLLGAKVYQSIATIETSHKINLTGIRKGIYVVKVTDGKEQFTRKMVVN
jgi:hypothetical protein